MNEYYYSETFFSFQGEGKYVGVPSAWLRLFSCNLQCDGFGQDAPEDPLTYKLPYKSVDLINIKDITEIPVFDKGCDSSYTWSKRFKHLMKKDDVLSIEREIRSHLPYNRFNHQNGMNYDFVITGGEPLINQECIIELVNNMVNTHDFPKRITIETNGTKVLKPEFKHFIQNVKKNYDIDFFFSVSPKLYYVSGELPDRAIKLDVLKEFCYYPMQLKFVVNGKQEAWDQVEYIFKSLPIEAKNIYIMGVGGTLEGLKVSEANIANETIKRGYNYTTRAHVHVFGNQIGT